MQLSPNVEGQGVPFDSKGEPQQLIQTRLNSFNPLSVCPLLLSSKIWIWLNGCTTQPERRCHLFVLSVPGFSVRHGDKCTHMHTLKHSVMVMMNQCQNLYHWVISKGTCLQVLMWGALVYYSAALISGWTCHILSPVWKVHSPVCWGPQGTLISGTIALLALAKGWLHSLLSTAERCKRKNLYFCVCALSGLGANNEMCTRDLCLTLSTWPLKSSRGI